MLRQGRTRVVLRVPLFFVRGSIFCRFGFLPCATMTKDRPGSSNRILVVQVSVSNTWRALAKLAKPNLVCCVVGYVARSTERTTRLETLSNLLKPKQAVSELALFLHGQHRRVYAPRTFRFALASRAPKHEKPPRSTSLQVPYIDRSSSFAPVAYGPLQRKTQARGKEKEPLPYRGAASPWPPRTSCIWRRSRRKTTRTFVLATNSSWSLP